MRPRPARVGAAGTPKEVVSVSPTQSSRGAHSTRFLAWVYQLAILIGAFILPAPQAGEDGGGHHQGRRKQPRKSYMQSTRKPDAPSAEQ